jgi:uroporphyrin-III C-methyltransferase/precorrin-2 dehydrogenase/sirohydrochlorin ferrochelatase
VILMGMRNLPAVTARLIKEGVPPDSAATCVADASLPAQRVVRTRLEDLPAQVAAAGLANPATVIVQGHPPRPDECS